MQPDGAAGPVRVGFSMKEKERTQEEEHVFTRRFSRWRGGAGGGGGGRGRWSLRWAAGR